MRIITIAALIAISILLAGCQRSGQQSSSAMDTRLPSPTPSPSLLDL